MARLPHHFEGKLGERFSLCHDGQGVLVVRDQLCVINGQAKLLSAIAIPN